MSREIHTHGQIWTNVDRGKYPCHNTNQSDEFTPPNSWQWTQISFIAARRGFCHPSRHADISLIFNVKAYFPPGTAVTTLRATHNDKARLRIQTANDPRLQTGLGANENSGGVTNIAFLLNRKRRWRRALAHLMISIRRCRGRAWCRSHHHEHHLRRHQCRRKRRLGGWYRHCGRGRWFQCPRRRRGNLR